MLFVSPLVDLGATVWPLRPGELSWRYGFLGLAAGYLHTPLLGLSLAGAVAYWRGDAGVLRLLGWVSGVAAAVLLVALVAWPFDVARIRGLRTDEVRSGVAVGGVIQGAKYAAACLVAGMLGVGSVRTARAIEVRRS